MRIAMVTRQAFPEDIRIEKEAGSLIEAGHEVFICTPSSGQIGDCRERYQVIEFDDSFSAFSALAGSLHRVLQALEPQVLHVQDTPASLDGYLAAKSLALPLILDIHEIWPSLVLENSPTVTHREVFWSKSLEIREAITSFAADIVLTVVGEATRYYMEKYHFLNGRTFSICNFEIAKRLENIRPSDEVKDLNCFKVAYVGGLDGPIRGIEEVILAAALLSNENVRFLIVGAGRHMEWLQQLVAELKLKKNVRFLGSKRFRDAMEIVAASDLCLVPHRNCISTQNTLPHKISQYMALRKPVVSTNLAPIKRLFHSAFFPWEPRTPQKLVELINSARENSSQAQEIAQRAYNLVSEKYRWEEEGKRLAIIYESLSPR